MKLTHVKFFGVIVLIIFGCIMSGFAGMLWYKTYKLPEMLDAHKPEPVIKTENKIHYVERSKTLTSDFLLHLNPNLDPDLAKIIAVAVDASSEKYGLPRKLVCSIMRKESNINPSAKSNKGAAGLMQVMPKIWKEKIGDRNIWHIAVNVDVGCSIFREYLDTEKGNMYKTFHRYLGLKATKEQIEKYSGGIYAFWAKLEMFDYLSIEERKKNQNGDHKEDIEERVIKEDDAQNEPE